MSKTVQGTVVPWIVLSGNKAERENSEKPSPCLLLPYLSPLLEPVTAAVMWRRKRTP